jgi:hypothetical protein
MPQIVFGPFMPGTMVEVVHNVKPLVPGRESPLPAPFNAVADTGLTRP